MEEEIKRFIQKHNMIQENDTIIIGVSGGPDSMALLNILLHLIKEYHLRLIVAHVHHGLRGEAADQDQLLVEKTCLENRIICEIKQVDVNKAAKEQGLTVEEAGRTARYDFFTFLCEKYHTIKVAVAHHQNDQVETVLHHFIRGAGLKGLCGMQPVREDGLIRPLLTTRREDIEKYCQVNQIQYRTDATNFSTEYTRNALRLSLIPEIEKRFNPNVIQNISQMSLLLADDQAWLDQMTQEAFQKTVSIENNGVKLDKLAMGGMPKALVRRIIRKSIQVVKGDIINLEKKHVEIVANLVSNGRTGAQVQLPQGICVICDDQHIVLGRELNAEIKSFEQSVQIPGVTTLPLIQRQIIARYTTTDNMVFEPNRAYIDMNQLGDKITVRSRRNGDQFIPFGMTGKKKVKDLLIDAKIPQRDRQYYPILCSDDEIVWVTGIRTAEKYKISKKSANVIEFLVKIMDNL